MQHGDDIPWPQWADHERGFADRLKSAAYKGYGLGPNWVGPRALGDVGFTGDRLDTLGLTHLATNDPDGQAVHVHTLPSASADALEVMAVRSGLAAVSEHGASGVLEDAEVVRVEFTVDGTRTPADGYRVDDGWLLQVDLPDTTLVIEGHGVELEQVAQQHTIERVDDLEPYFEGRLELLQRTWER